jgi:hypothetical protein
MSMRAECRWLKVPRRESWPDRRTGIPAFTRLAKARASDHAVVHGPLAWARSSVKIQPKGAQIAVNKHMLDKSSPVDGMLDPGNYPGNYIVDITLTGYAPVHKVMTVDKGRKGCR